MNAGNMTDEQIYALTVKRREAYEKVQALKSQGVSGSKLLEAISSYEEASLKLDQARRQS